MSWSPTTPITGAAQTGFTSPTYTIVSDLAPDVNGKQVAVSALGGTQAGVTVHSVSSPFTGNFVRPKTFAVLGKPNPTTGLISSVPKNEYKLIVRKGVTPLAGQPIQPLIIDVKMSVPAGSDTADPANVRAALSFAFGLLAQQSAGVGDTTVSGVV
jgi:hypothetical protein